METIVTPETQVRDPVCGMTVTPRRQQARAHETVRPITFAHQDARRSLTPGQTLSTPTRLMKAHTRITA